RLVEPLRLGTMQSAVLRLDRYWIQHFQQRAAAAGVLLDDDVRATTLLDWLSRSMGLDPLTAQLIVVAFAEQTNRSFFVHGGPPGTIDPGRSPPGLTLRPQRMPDMTAWQTATERAYKLFRLPQRGPAAGRLVTLFANQLAAAAKGYREDAHRLLS